MRANEEKCELNEAVKRLDDRVTNIETRMDAMEGSLSVGFSQVNSSIQQLATDFGTRMNTLDQRIVEEKAKWGETLRDIVKWSVRVILLGAAAAMGVTAWKTIFAT